MSTDARKRSLSLRLGLALTGLGLIGALVTGPGTRLGWWSFRVGLSGLGVSVLSGAGGGLCLAWYLLREATEGTKQSVMEAAIGLALAALLVGVPARWLLAARNAPMIHDITTDTKNPPTFRALAAARRQAPNRVDHPGDTAARLQRKAYPDVQPLRVDHPPADVLAAARRAARSRGWTVAATDTPAGRLEAVDRTFWFGFHDDVVVRAVEVDGSTRVDVRSASRVGKSDLGTNARRIHRFLSALEVELSRNVP